MSSKQYKTREILKIFQDIGFRVDSIKGSHIKMVNDLKKHIVIPNHSKGVNRMIIRRLLKEAGSEKFSEY